jgi:polysaccharide pyruvyl transferase WcaK-like protein
LNQILKSDFNIDYIGTRLHAGICAIQNFRRSIIIGIDNRAIEMGNDFNLNVIEPENVNILDEIIKSDLITDISIPKDNIDIWKKQFMDVSI